MRKNIRSMAALVLAMVAACTTTEHEPKRGELVLLVQTDLTIPKDISSIRVEVLKTGRVQFAQTYLVGPTPLLEMPATLSVVAGDDPSEPVSIRILARQVSQGADGDQGIPRVLREIVTTVPPNRSALLPVTLQWLCADEKSVVVSGSDVSTACPDGETCVAGSCETQEIDSATLPDFDVRIAEGTAPDSGCFDVTTCVSTAPLAPVDPKTCTVAAPPGDESLWNVAIRLPLDSGGTCDESHCFVPLNAGEEGWKKTSAGAIQLPASVCEGTKPLEIVVGAGCPRKTALMPLCGSASRFDTSAPGTPDTPPDNMMMMPGGAGTGNVPELVLLEGVKAPRHVVVEPSGVLFLASVEAGVDGLYGCALSGCNSQAQLQWQAPQGTSAYGFAHNSSQIGIWTWGMQTTQVHACPFPGGCSAGGSSQMLASSPAAMAPMFPLQGALAMTDSAFYFREVEPGTRIMGCTMLDTGCGAAPSTVVTDSSPVLSLTTSGTSLIWANAAGELKHCQADDCTASVATDANQQLFAWGPVASGQEVVWGSDRAVRSCSLSDCAGTMRNLFTPASPLTALATDGTYAYFGFLRTPQPPVHDLVKIPLDGSAGGQTLRSGNGILGGTGVDGDFVYSFVVDQTTMLGSLIRTSKDAVTMPMPQP